MSIAIHLDINYLTYTYWHINPYHTYVASFPLSERNIVITFYVFFILGTLRTSFLSGSTFNVTWHLAYPHRVSKSFIFFFWKFSSSSLILLAKGFGMLNDVHELFFEYRGNWCYYLHSINGARLLKYQNSRKSFLIILYFLRQIFW